MNALVLEKVRSLSLRPIPIDYYDSPLAPHDVRIAIHTVGICVPAAGGGDVRLHSLRILMACETSGAAPCPISSADGGKVRE